ncbi:MAG: MopE-related protein, partial [Myxococcota bacterium]
MSICTTSSTANARPQPIRTLQNREGTQIRIEDQRIPHTAFWANTMGRVSIALLLGVLGCTDGGEPETASTTDSNGGGASCTCDDANATCPGRVTGIVTAFSDGQRLSGVQVAADMGAASFETDTSGEYELEVNACRSPYRIRATLARYCAYTDFVNITEQTVARNDIALQERYVGGIVLDMTPNGATGEPLREPLEGIQVSLLGTTINERSNDLGIFLLDNLPDDGELTLVAQDDRPDDDTCYETALVDRVQTCSEGNAGVQVEMQCRNEANNGCGLCCTGARALPEGASPGDYCQRESPCAVGEEPVWVCDNDLRGARCDCTACPEDNSRGEVCDGRDNDCDGVTDNPESRALLDNCDAPEGAFALECAAGVCRYTCENGRVDINGDLVAGSRGNGCECALTNGGQEVCDGIDNDCDGTIDNDPQPILCEVQTGVCQGALSACVEGEQVCTDTEYAQSAMDAGEAFEGVGGLEVVCDGLDNNCDGLADENCCDIDEGHLSDGFRLIADDILNVGGTPQMVLDANRQVGIILWTSLGEGNSVDLKMVVLDGAFLNLNNEVKVIANDIRSFYPPSIAWDGIGFSIVWEESDNVAGERKYLKWRRVGLDGEYISPERTLIDRDSTSL